MDDRTTKLCTQMRVVDERPPPEQRLSRATTEELTETGRLKRQVRELEGQRDILKKRLRS